VQHTAGRLATLALVSLFIACAVLSAGCIRDRDTGDAGPTPPPAAPQQTATATPTPASAPADGGEIDLFEPVSEDEDFGDVI
jgi:hypothetical protein